MSGPAAGAALRARRLARRAAGRLAPVLLRAAAPLERRRLRRPEHGRPIAHPPIFLVGAPRTGSTLLYQLLTNHFAVDYVSNFACLFHHSLFYGVRLHRALFGDAAFNRFESEHGRTDAWRDPSECGKFWYRWFPGDRHFVAAGELPPEALAEIRGTFAALAAAHGRPMVIKNLNCGQRLQVLHQALPEALFVFCRRDAVGTCLSILQGRRRVHGDPERWWSVMPRNVDELRRLPYPAQVARQVHALEAQIAADLPRFPRAQWTEVWYEDLCRDPEEVLARVDAFARENGVGLRLREGAVLPHLSRPERRSADPDRARVAEEVGRLDWGFGGG